MHIFKKLFVLFFVGTFSIQAEEELKITPKSLCSPFSQEKELTGHSPLMKKINEDLQNVINSSDVKNKAYSSGYLYTTPFHGGQEVLEQMALLIKKAKSEILIDTSFFKINSTGANLITTSLLELYDQQKINNSKTPIEVKLIVNVLENPSKKYLLNFPIELDPRWMKLTIKHIQHKNLPIINHSKSIIVDQLYFLLTGANISGYFQDESIPKEKSNELFLDYGLLFTGNIAQVAAQNFFHFWYKTFEDKKDYLVEVSGNVIPSESDFGRERKSFLESNNFIMKRTPQSEIELMGPSTILETFEKNFKSLNIITKELGRWEKIPSIILLGKKHQLSFGSPKFLNWMDKKIPFLKYFKRDNPNTQNEVIFSAIRNAKFQINMVTSNINNPLLLKNILMSIQRGVNFNILLPKRSAQVITDHLFSERRKMIKKSSVIKIGQLNIKWVEDTELSQNLEEEFWWNHNSTTFISSDNEISIFGTANLDSQNFQSSRETNILFQDKKMTQHLCEKIFMNDFLKARGFGEKKWPGEKCFQNEECGSDLVCNNQCIYQLEKGPEGGFCLKDQECKSGICNPKGSKCL